MSKKNHLISFFKESLLILHLFLAKESPLALYFFYRYFRGSRNFDTSAGI